MESVGEDVAKAPYCEEKSTSSDVVTLRLPVDYGAGDPGVTGGRGKHYGAGDPVVTGGRGEHRRIAVVQRTKQAGVQTCAQRVRLSSVGAKKRRRVLKQF